MRAASLRILLVEDSPSDAALLEESLAQSGPPRFGFTVVDRWQEAARRLAEEEFDVLLLDLSLPDVSGRETFRRARAAVPHLPIVVLTGEASEALGLDAVRHGIQDYLIKGQTYGPHTARAIRYAVERKQAEEALKRTEAALRQSERQLRQSNHELERRVAERTASLARIISDLEDFSHSLTHDLRAPLRAIRSFADLLGEECATFERPAAQDYIRRISNAAERMDRLIQDVLQYSRLAQSELPLTAVALDPLLRGIIASYPAFQPGAADIRIEGTLPRVLGNEAALTQCVSNLLSNAVKFVAPGVHPQVRIWAEPEPPAPEAPRNTQHATRTTPSPLVRLWFADNGVGIPREHQERIFKLFHQLDRSYEGTGVGLTVARKAAERMGGRLGLESEPGRGSRFWLELRAAAEAVSPQQGTTDEHR